MKLMNTKITNKAGGGNLRSMHILSPKPTGKIWTKGRDNAERPTRRKKSKLPGTEVEEL